VDKDSVLKQFGTNLKKIRQEQSISQEELASMAGLDRTYISYLEMGTRNPSFFCIIKLCLALNCNFSELCGPIKIAQNTGKQIIVK
jgi:transcriptional regulator with XRE-family HTH domain